MLVLNVTDTISLPISLVSGSGIRRSSLRWRRSTISAVWMCAIIDEQFPMFLLEVFASHIVPVWVFVCQLFRFRRLTTSGGFQLTCGNSDTQELKARLDVLFSVEGPAQTGPRHLKESECLKASGTRLCDFFDASVFPHVHNRSVTLETLSPLITRRSVNRHCQRPRDGRALETTGSNSQSQTTDQSLD